MSFSHLFCYSLLLNAFILGLQHNSSKRHSIVHLFRFLIVVVAFCFTMHQPTVCYRVILVEEHGKENEIECNSYTQTYMVNTTLLHMTLCKKRKTKEPQINAVYFFSDDEIKLKMLCSWFWWLLLVSLRNVSWELDRNNRIKVAWLRLEDQRN